MFRWIEWIWINWRVRDFVVSRIIGNVTHRSFAWCGDFIRYFNQNMEGRGSFEIDYNMFSLWMTVISISHILSEIKNWLPFLNSCVVLHTLSLTSKVKCWWQSFKKIIFQYQVSWFFKGFVKAEWRLKIFNCSLLVNQRIIFTFFRG